jgi:hypothetical protein
VWVARNGIEFIHYARFHHVVIGLCLDVYLALCCVVVLFNGEEREVSDNSFRCIVVFVQPIRGPWLKDIQVLLGVILHISVGSIITQNIPITRR